MDSDRELRSLRPSDVVALNVGGSAEPMIERTVAKTSPVHKMAYSQYT